MFRRGVGVEGVASEIGAIGDDDFIIDKENLLKGLCYRFGINKEEAEFAIKRSIEVGVVEIVCVNKLRLKGMEKLKNG